MVSRVSAIREREGNPEGAEFKKFGHSTAFYIKTMPWGTFNTVKGITLDDSDLLDEIIDFYHKRDRQCQFEIIPSKSSPELFQRLASKGFYQNAFHTSMYGLPNFVSPTYPANLRIREIEENEFELYGKLHCLGSGLAESGAKYVAANNQILFGRSGWRFFIGFINETAAGVAVMHINNGIASMTFAATLPAYRGQGLQSAFIHKRMHEAALENCELVVSQCAYASTSQNNMERAGMRIGYTRATWIETRRSSTHGH
ncbi:GNAT family N-acetyltransferase [Paenibacillus sp. 5J-6]|uniref:GNAT family N-acetyltransferase n=2 Tax=Paenibacillus silvestris TaxID=2606219 RepID=A0A6L8V9I5_9BACL|nr:GNAT family N-acetyltransferase [Paenibacillus silvestris]